MSADIQTIARGDASRILQAQRAVVRNDEEWRDLWEAHAGPATVPPPVDFAARMVAAVFQGQRASAGFDSSIVDAHVDGDALTIQVDEHAPDRGRMAAQVLVSPFHIVSMPRVDGEVRFSDAHQQANEITQSAEPPATAKRRRTQPLGATATIAAPITGAAAGRISSTGLSPEFAGAMAYLAGPFSGALLLIVERTSRDVRFHAWQALIGLGALGLTAVVSLGLAFLLLIVSPRIFSVMLWLAAGASVVWIALWAVCLAQAYKGRRWKMPLAGSYAERLAGK